MYKIQNSVLQNNDQLSINTKFAQNNQGLHMLLSLNNIFSTSFLNFTQIRTGTTVIQKIFSSSIRTNPPFFLHQPMTLF